MKKRLLPLFLVVVILCSSSVLSFASSGTVTLDVPKVYQGSSDGLCWAACVASIVNYQKGTSYTAQDIKNKVGSSIGSAANINKAFEECDLTPVCCTMQMGSLVQLINQDYPVLLLLTGPDGRGHAVVARGYWYGFSNGTGFSYPLVMNPAYPRYEGMSFESYDSDDQSNYYITHNNSKFTWAYSFYAY